jgi:hydroxyethylthiazole kinase-like uncharacterized protein yjeF
VLDVLPIVTPEQMRAIDATAPVPEAVLIARAGAAVGRTALRMLGGGYGRRVVVLAGTGNNGADGRIAGTWLARRGVRVEVIEVAAAPPVLPSCDLVVDAAFGTGFRGSWDAPALVPGARVLAVDIPSGVDGLTGEVRGRVLTAERTVCLVALKPGLVLPPGSSSTGPIEIVDIGLPAAGARMHLVQRSDVLAWVPERSVDHNKWRSAVWAIAGSGGMIGAAHLVGRAAQRAGAGMVRLSSPGVAADPTAPEEAVRHPLGVPFWAAEALGQVERFHSVVVGPGLGRAEGTVTSIREFVAKAPVPLVVDADALFALAWGTDGALSILRQRPAPTVLTPHDGEFALLRGGRIGTDRVEAVRDFAVASGCVVLLKGPSTLVADPGGHVAVVTTGDQRLATAGTGDVLAGIIGAFLAQRVPATPAAAAGAWVHGSAARLGPLRGFVAGDLADLIPEVWAET